MITALLLAIVTSPSPQVEYVPRVEFVLTERHEPTVGVNTFHTKRTKHIHLHRRGWFNDTYTETIKVKSFPVAELSGPYKTFAIIQSLTTTRIKTRDLRSRVIRRAAPGMEWLNK